MKRIEKFSEFNENWRDSDLLRDTNAQTGVFDEEEGVEADLQHFQELADKSFNELFEKPFNFAEECLFGGNFKEYMDSRNRDKNIVESYQELVRAYKDFRDTITDDIRAAQDNYGHG